MIARGHHIESLNESFAICKSEGGVPVLHQDSPYRASAGLDNTEEIRKALSPGFTADIDSAMAKRQEGR